MCWARHVDYGAAAVDGPVEPVLGEYLVMGGGQRAGALGVHRGDIGPAQHDVGAVAALDKG
ncbi:hypothetical protein ACFRIC_38855 [Streptomyces sp. NPDC056738]|uniref:hypothetical protein n=1 Tax=Streptomyces sp. NPDC056738 TaxID=3345933 RepID=UPI0036C080C9